MIGFILFIISIPLFLLLTMVNVRAVYIKHRTWKSVNDYFYQSTVDFDRFGNHNFRTILNMKLITENGYQFGDFRETISSVLGKNQRDQTLTKLGKRLVSFLDWIDPNHCKKSIMIFKEYEKNSFIDPNNYTILSN